MNCSFCLWWNFYVLQAWCSFLQNNSYSDKKKTKAQHISIFSFKSLLLYTAPAWHFFTNYDTKHLTTIFQCLCCMRNGYMPRAFIDWIIKEEDFWVKRERTSQPSHLQFLVVNQTATWSSEIDPTIRRQLHYFSDKKF